MIGSGGVGGCTSRPTGAAVKQTAHISPGSRYRYPSAAGRWRGSRGVQRCGVEVGRVDLEVVLLRHVHEQGENAVCLPTATPTICVLDALVVQGIRPYECVEVFLLILSGANHRAHAREHCPSTPKF